MSSSTPPPPPPNNNIAKARNRGDDVIDIGGSKTTMPAPDSGRSDLLAAIRASGGISGAGLKKAEERERSPSSNTEPVISGNASSQNTGGLDLMGEITRKLAMRRKGMSGKANQEGGSSNRNVSNPSVPKPTGAMDKISSMIPPPPSNNENQRNEESDDEW